MTENTKIAMQAINKWFYYAMNYRVVEVEVADFDGNHTEVTSQPTVIFPLPPSCISRMTRFALRSVSESPRVRPPSIRESSITCSW